MEEIWECRKGSKNEGKEETKKLWNEGEAHQYYSCRGGGNSSDKYA